MRGRQGGRAGSAHDADAAAGRGAAARLEDAQRLLQPVERGDEGLPGGRPQRQAFGVERVGEVAEDGQRVEAGRSG